MKIIGVIGLCLAPLSAFGFGTDDPLDRIDDALTTSAFQDSVRARLSGTLDLEGYHLQSPAPGLIFAPGENLFNPRLSTYLDAQLGPYVYAFAEWRLDRGFDPSDSGIQSRLDEAAIRLTPWDDGRVNLQIGKFATVVGTWVARHNSWDNPFVTAPLLYENLTGIWDVEAVPSGNTLLAWANLGPRSPPSGGVLDESRSVPIIWGPSYASGASLFGEVGKFVYAAEVKNASLSSRPGAWSPAQSQWKSPTFSGRLGYMPDEMWSLGFSASSGSYLRPSVVPPAAYGLGDFREIVLGQDASFAWHHLQVWAELYEARFEIPPTGNAGTTAYYVETKFKFTPQLFGALRWNQQLFSTVPLLNGTSAPWGRDVWRIDFGPGYRFTPHTQLKLQYSLQHETATTPVFGSLLAVQFTVRF